MRKIMVKLLSVGGFQLFDNPVSPDHTNSYNVTSPIYSCEELGNKHVVSMQ